MFPYFIFTLPFLCLCTCIITTATGQQPICNYIIIIVIIIIIDISFMQGIYTYIPEANHVPREHCVATILM